MNSDEAIGGGGGIKFLFRALRHKNYRLFFGGQGISVIGTWMQGTALGWVIRDMTGNDALFWLGFIPAIGQLPTCGLPLLTGVLADRWNRRKILLVTQSLAMVQALVLAILMYTHVLGIGHIIMLAVAIGLINSFDIPTRQSFTIDMVEDRADLGNAIALNSSLVNGARIIGPAIGGYLLGEVGAASCFFLNAASYLAVIYALAAMKVPARQGPPTAHHVLHDLKEGFRYATGSRPIRTVLMLIALISFMGVSYGTLMPAVARDVLHVGPHKFGAMYSAVGLGALGGAVFLASRKTVRGMKTTIAITTCVFGIGLVLFALVPSLGLPMPWDYWLSMPLLVVVGLGFMITMSASNTFLQAIVDDDKRGRVMSFWTMSFMGMVPLGSLYTGLMASTIGSMHTILIGGMACVLGGVVFSTRLPMLRRLTHPIYISKGLIPQVVLAGARIPAQSAEETVQFTDPVSTPNNSIDRNRPD